MNNETDCIEPVKEKGADAEPGCAGVDGLGVPAPAPEAVSSLRLADGMGVDRGSGRERTKDASGPTAADRALTSRRRCASSSTLSTCSRQVDWMASGLKSTGPHRDCAEGTKACLTRTCSSQRRSCLQRPTAASVAHSRHAVFEAPRSCRASTTITTNLGEHGTSL